MDKHCRAITTIAIKGKVEIEVALDERHPHVWVHFRHPHLPVDFVMDLEAADRMANVFSAAYRVLRDHLDDANLSPEDREESIDLHKPPV